MSFENKILMLLRTKSLRYDDRVRKECMMIKAMESTVVVAVVESDCNQKETFYLDGVKYHRVGLVTRVFPRSRFLVMKTLEMYFRFFTIILRERPSILWAHNMEMAGITACSKMLRMLGLVQAVVWDNHELPRDGTLRSRARRWTVRKVVSWADGVVVANRERQVLLTRMKLLSSSSLVLENFPDARFVGKEPQELPADLSNWLDGKGYYLAQGGASPNRNFESLAQAIIQNRWRLVVVGDRAERTTMRLEARFGEKAVHRHIYFTGWVDKDDLSKFIDFARAAIILYSMSCRNGRYCAPNRLYQALCRGVPVIVGCNPPLRRIVSGHGCGIVGKSDGKDIDDIARSIYRFQLTEDKIKGICKNMQNYFTFETQYDQFEYWMAAILKSGLKSKDIP